MQVSPFMVEYRSAFSEGVVNMNKQTIIAVLVLVLGYCLSQVLNDNGQLSTYSGNIPIKLMKSIHNILTNVILKKLY